MKAYAIKVIWEYNKKEISYVHNLNSWNYVYNLKDAKKWKTEQGVQKALETLKKRLEHNKSYNKSYQCPSLKIIKIDYEEKPKKKSLSSSERKQIKENIIDLLLKNNWKSNKKYMENLDDRGNCSWGGSYLIDSNNKYAISIKSNVVTIHDSERQFCKVISMPFNKLKITNKELVCEQIKFEV